MFGFGDFKMFSFILSFVLVLLEIIHLKNIITYIDAKSINKLGG